MKLLSVTLCILRELSNIEATKLKLMTNKCEPSHNNTSITIAMNLSVVFKTHMNGDRNR